LRIECAPLQISTGISGLDLSEFCGFSPEGPAFPAWWWISGLLDWSKKMSEPFLSEIKIVSFNFPPKGWALCNGQFLPINQNQALFALLGTTYGGNGQTTFALPDLRGCVPIHIGNGHTLGEKAGSTSVTLNIQQLPTHTHQLNGTAVQSSLDSPTNNLIGKVNINEFGGPSSLVPMQAGTVSNVGGSQPHNNMMPYLVLNFIIALQGIFPSQN
jgi:microcystin-dependent protein